MDESQIEDVRSKLAGCRADLVDSLHFPDVEWPVRFVYNVAKAHECLQRRIVELADGALACAQAGLAVSAVVLARSCVETTAAIHFLARLADQASNGDDMSAIQGNLRRISFGGKDARVGDVEAINVLTMIKHGAKKLGDVFQKVYDESSEYAHPNYLGTMGIYSAINGDSVTFGSQRISETLQLAILGLGASLELARIERKYLAAMLPAIEANLRTAAAPKA